MDERLPISALYIDDLPILADKVSKTSRQRPLVGC